MEQDVRSFYQEEALRIDKEKEKLGKDYNRIAWSRLIVFLAAVILLYMGLTERPGKIIYLIGGIAGFAAFLFLIRLHDGIEKKQRLLAARETAVRAYPERFTDGWRDFPENGSSLEQHCSGVRAAVNAIYNLGFAQGYTKGEAVSQVFDLPLENCKNFFDREW